MLKWAENERFPWQQVIARLIKSNKIKKSEWRNASLLRTATSGQDAQAQAVYLVWSSHYSNSSPSTSLRQAAPSTLLSQTRISIWIHQLPEASL